MKISHHIYTLHTKKEFPVIFVGIFWQVKWDIFRVEFFII